MRMVEGRLLKDVVREAMKFGGTNWTCRHAIKF